MPETQLQKVDRLMRQLAECHKAMLLTAEDFEELAKRPGYSASQQDQWLRAAELLRAFVQRQKAHR